MNAIELLTQDHRQVERLFADFDDNPGDDRETILARIIRELSIHAAIEEAYLYPRVRHEMPVARSHVADGEHEYRDIKESLACLDGRLASADTEDVADQVAALKQKTAHHVDESERELFPAIAAVARRRELDELGHAMQKAKGSAPTRPHPKQPALNGFTIRVNGLVDRARDAVAGRPR